MGSHYCRGSYDCFGGTARFYRPAHFPAETKAKHTGAHLSFNGVALVLFTANAFMLYGQWNTALPLIIAGFVCTLTAGFLGWTLVQTYHVGVSERVDPPSLEGEAARLIMKLVNCLNGKWQAIVKGKMKGNL
jgi:hypothetical protein